MAARSVVRLARTARGSSSRASPLAAACAALGVAANACASAPDATDSGVARSSQQLAVGEAEGHERDRSTAQGRESCPTETPSECLPAPGVAPRPLEPLSRLSGAADDIEFPWISADGSTAIANSHYPDHSDAGDMMMPWRWTQATGLNGLLVGDTLSVAQRSDASGSTIIGTQLVDLAYVATRWIGATVDHMGLERIGASAGVDVSDDGSIVLGNRLAGGSSPEGILLWDPRSGVEFLSERPEVAFALSGDGEALVGAVRRDAHPGELFVWRRGSGREYLTGLPGADYQLATDMNRDGSVAVGAAVFGSSALVAWPRTRALLWSSTSKVLDLGTLAGSESSFASGVSADGRVVVGTSGEAMIWDPSRGMRALRVVLREAGVDTGPWVLDHATSVSADGKSVVGYGRCGCAPKSWIARLP